MKRGFALVIALAFFVLAGTLTTILLIFGSNAGAMARTGLELQAARRAAEAGARIAEERVAQYASLSYYSDPIEAYYWYGGDLPAGAVNAQPDGVLSNDGEVVGFDTGMDGLPDLLEPGFIVARDQAAGGGALIQDLDPAGDDWNAGDGITGPLIGDPLLARLEGNARHDRPQLNGNKARLVGKLPGAGLNFLAGTNALDEQTGLDDRSSLVELTQVYISPATGFQAVPYHPISNPDPAGDDYHPIFNPRGLEGRAVVAGAPPTAAIEATVENPETHWRRHIHKLGDLAEFGDGKLKGYTATRVVDTSTKIDLNGADFLTARLIQGLLYSVGTSPGPITVENQSLGYNGRGIEAYRPIPGVALPAAFANTAVGSGPIALLEAGSGFWSLMDWPQFPLYPNPAFHNIGFDLFANNLPSSLVTPFAPPYPLTGAFPNPPRKIAASKAEEDAYFAQPVNELDPDAVAIVKFRNQNLGGRFASVDQLLQVRRFDGSLIFPDRDRDEMVRLSQFLTIEVWRDSQTISRRNGDYMMSFDPVANRFQWDPFAISYADPEPWQDIFVDGIFEGGERFDDFGLDNLFSDPSRNILAAGGGNPNEPIRNALLYDNPATLWIGDYHPFWNPDPALDDFHTIWNPFFVRSYQYRSWDFPPGQPDYNQHLLLAGGRKAISVDSTRYGTQAWSPFLGGFGPPLSHIHYSDWFAASALHTAGAWAGTPLFNYDALEGNGILDLDPYRVDPNPIDAEGDPVGGAFERNPYPAFPFAHGPNQSIGYMWAERWNPLAYNPTGGALYFPLANHDFGVDQLNSVYDFTSLAPPSLMDPRYNPGLGFFPFRDELYYNLSNISATDPDNDNADFDDNFASPPPLTYAFGFTGSLGCGGPLTNLFAPAKAWGGEGNLRFDPYPEIGHWDPTYGQPHDMPFRDDYYSTFPSPALGVPINQFLSPTFFPLQGPAANQQLEPPIWARPDKDWFVEPGEQYDDLGRDGMRNSGDFGEGNGMWDPGEPFNDFGVDARSLWDEQGFSIPNPSPTAVGGVWSNCFIQSISIGGPPVSPGGDFHGDDFSVLSGVQRGSENDGQFNLIREPYLDLNRDGRWNRGNTIREEGVPPVFPTPIVPPILTPGVHGGGNFNPNTTGLGAFRDRNGDRLYDHGIFREPRAPVNVNAAPEEVLAAVLYEGFLYPAKKRRDRFCLVNEDIPSVGLASEFDDYDWATAIWDTDATGSFFRPNYRFADNLARGLARAIWLRRMGLYNPVAAPVASIGSGPFRSWTEFELFITTLLNTPAETNRFDTVVAASIHPAGATDAFGLLLVDPFTLGNVAAYPNNPPYTTLTNPYAPALAGAAAVRQLMIDRILVQANPNTRLRGSVDYNYQSQAIFDKSDFPFPTTEFCFGPTGVFEITSVGYAVSAAPTPSGQLSLTAQVVGAGFALPSEDVLGSFDVRASVEVKKTVRIFEHKRLSTLSDFEGSNPISRGVSILPQLAETKAPTPEAHVSFGNIFGPSTGIRGSSPSLQSPFGPFLFVLPDVTVFDPVRNLLFVSSNLPFNPAVNYANWNDQPIVSPPVDETGGIIQIFDWSAQSNSFFSQLGVKNVPLNNGVSFDILLTMPPPPGPPPPPPPNWVRCGAIQAGNGLVDNTVLVEPTIQAMEFDPYFPRPVNFPDENAHGGAWKNFPPTITSPGYSRPLEINYLGRLYVLDNNPVNQRLRALDIGRDGTGGLISQEVEFAVPASVQYPGRFGVAMKVVPERREIYIALTDRDPNPNAPIVPGTGSVFIRRLRYPEALTYPAVDATGKSLLAWVEAEQQVIPLTTVDLDGGGGVPAPLPLQVFLVKDEKSGYLYIGGSTTPNGTAGEERDVRVFRIDPFPPLAATSLAQIFPWPPPPAVNFVPPGFRPVTEIPPINPGDQRRRELVGLQSDPGSGLLFALWNFTRSTNLGFLVPDPPGWESNGSGAYLAAIPTGAAPFLTVPLMNPFPMTLSQPELFGVNMDHCPVGEQALQTTQYLGDNYPIYAASMALEPVYKTLFIAPREQECVSVPIVFNPAPPPILPICPGTGTDATPLQVGDENPWALDKNRPAIVTYGGDGIRRVDSLSPFRLNTNPPVPGQGTSWVGHPLYNAPAGNSYGPGRGRSRPVNVHSFPGRGLFFLSIPAPLADLFAGPAGQGAPGQCPVIGYDPTNLPGGPFWWNTRSVQMFSVRGHNFGIGNRPADHWQDGRLVAKTNAVPLSGFYGNGDGGGALMREPWIHSRANFEGGPFFMSPEYNLSTPSYDLTTATFIPKKPTALQPLFCQTNAKVSGEGLVVDSSIAIKPVDLTGDGDTPEYPWTKGADWVWNDANYNPEEWADQRIVYPQDGVSRTKTITWPRPPATAVDPDSGWRVLDGGGEFFMRFGDLRNFVPPALVTDEIVIFENFTKAKAELQRVVGGGLTFAFNPFIGDGDPTDSVAERANLANILQAMSTEGLGQGFAGPIGTINQFFPDALEVWAYDRITMRNFGAGTAPNLFRADFVYERRLAGPAGQYPGIYLPPVNINGVGGSNDKSPWGTLSPLPAAPGAAGLDLGVPSFLYPFGHTNPPNALAAGNLNFTLGNLEERQKYCIVSTDVGIFRFAPIWSNSQTIPNNRQAAVQVVVPNVQLRQNGWLRIGFGSRVEFATGAPGSWLMKPSTAGGQTRLFIRTDGAPSIPGLVTTIGTGGGSLSPGRLNWYEFPGSREGYLAFGSTQLRQVASGVLTLLRPVNFPVSQGLPFMGGLTIPNFPFLVDDIVLYEGGRPATNYSLNISAQAQNIPRFGIGEEGWPANMNGGQGAPAVGAGNTGAFPNRLPLVTAAGLTRENVASPYMPAEPYFDFNGDGICNTSANTLPIPSVSFWDRNGNARWDFDDLPAYAGDVDGDPSLPVLVNGLIAAIGGIFGEPFQDLNGDGNYTARGDGLIDLNDNGVMDGEPFQDTNGNWVYDAGDLLFNDLNGNANWDGGEPYIDYPPSNGVYNPRYGEPYTNQDTAASPPIFDPGGALPETYFDENFNGRFDRGEPFTSWSRSVTPRAGELYRENGLVTPPAAGAYETDSLMFWNFAFGPPAINNPPNWSPTRFPYRGQTVPFPNTWGFPSNPDWNNDGRYEGAGVFEGTFGQALPAGSRIGALNFTVWRPVPISGRNFHGRVAIDLEFRAKDGRFLGRWMGADFVAVDAQGNIVFRDESGIGLPLAEESFVKFRVNFYLPNPRLDPTGNTLCTSSPILDDLSLTVILPQQNQVVYENKVTSPILVEGVARGVVQ